MRLWHISQTVNSDYDTYDGAVVAAATEEEARHTHFTPGTWAPPEAVEVRLIGEAPAGTEAGVILASFNAG